MAALLSEDEILKLYKDAKSFVDAHFRTSNNPTAKLESYKTSCIGRTHMTLVVEGINDANISYDTMRKFIEMFPNDATYASEASISHETRADGRTIVMKLNIPILFGRREAERRKIRVRGGTEPTTFEWPLFLTVVDGIIGGILYYKYNSGTLF
jgi:hypothetical protein